MITQEKHQETSSVCLSRIWGLRLIFCVFVVIAAAPRASWGQGSSCASTPDSLSLWRINTIRGLMHRTEPEIVGTLARLKIPVVTDTSSIVFVNDAKVCSKVRAAFNTHLTSIGATRPPATVVVVMRVGNVYIVRDTYASRDEWHYEMVINKQYGVLSAYGA